MRGVTAPVSGRAATITMGNWSQDHTRGAAGTGAEATMGSAKRPRETRSEMRDVYGPDGLRRLGTAAVGASSRLSLPLPCLRNADRAQIAASDSSLDALPSEPFRGVSIEPLHQGATIRMSELMGHVLGG